MRNIAISGLCLLLFLPLPAVAADDPALSCGMFYNELSLVPHDRLVQNIGRLRSENFVRGDFNGCEVIFASREELFKEGDSLPMFEPYEDSELYRQGWRFVNRYTADGPGSGVHGIVRNQVLCLIDWDQHAWINEAGEHEQSNLINMTVQCLPAPAEALVEEEEAAPPEQAPLTMTAPSGITAGPVRNGAP